MESTRNRSSRLNKTLRSLPVHCLVEADLEDAGAIHEHFHAPYNCHNRFMTSITEGDKGFLREYERPAQYTIKEVPAGALGTRPSQRPTSAPAGIASCRTTTQHNHVQRQVNGDSTGHSDAGAGASVTRGAFLGRTQHGVPCFAEQKLVSADMLDGKPVRGKSVQGWRTARVMTYNVKAAKHGHGESGTRPFHQDYSHYKYYGYAGRGAKTSWGANPTKYSIIAVAADPQLVATAGAL